MFFSLALSHYFFVILIKQEATNRPLSLSPRCAYSLDDNATNITAFCHRYSAAQNRLCATMDDEVRDVAEVAASCQSPRLSCLQKKRKRREF